MTQDHVASSEQWFADNQHDIFSAWENAFFSLPDLKDCVNEFRGKRLGSAAPVFAPGTGVRLETYLWNEVCKFITQWGHKKWSTENWDRIVDQAVNTIRIGDTFPSRDSFEDCANTFLNNTLACVEVPFNPNCGIAFEVFLESSLHDHIRLWGALKWLAHNWCKIVGKVVSRVGRTLRNGKDFEDCVAEFCAKFRKLVLAFDEKRGIPFECYLWELLNNHIWWWWNKVFGPKQLGFDKLTISPQAEEKLAAIENSKSGEKNPAENAWETEPSTKSKLDELLPLKDRLILYLDYRKRWIDETIGRKLDLVRYSIIRRRKAAIGRIRQAAEEDPELRADLPTLLDQLFNDLDQNWPPDFGLSPDLDCDEPSL